MIQTHKEFHFQATKAHLTYKTFIKKEDFLKIVPAESLKILSFVHEIGEEKEEDPTPYEHTHVFVWWKKKFSTRDCRFWDIDGIHPNVAVRRSIAWAKHLCTKYHRGHKTGKDGKKYHKEPEMLYQTGVEEWKFEEELIDTITAAPTLRDAMLLTDIMPKSVSDLKLLRNEKKRKATEMEEGVDLDKFVKIDWDRSKALLLQGPPGIGKTNWALAQFERPQLICDIDDLKELPPDCDGLVFDEMIFFRHAKQTQTYLCDMHFERTVRCRSTNARIPAKTPRIFCHNFGEEVFDLESYPNLERRVAKMVRTEPLFK